MTGTSTAAGGRKLEGRVVAITGGTRGIGRAIAERFLAEGAKVAINGRTPEKGRQTLDEIKAGDNAIFIPGNVQQQADVERFVDQTAAHFGGLDIMVNNAGGSSGFAMVADLSDAAWNEAQNWILNSTFWGTRRALRYMLPNKWGRIINISSIEGRQANISMASHYITHKHAINGFSKAVAFEYGTAGITCNAMIVGPCETDLMLTVGPKFAADQGISYEEYKQHYAKNTALKRLVTLQEVSALALYVASRDGAATTGALLDVSGGTSL